MDTYDYIVIGAGSSGCTVITRLIEAGKSVLALEAGPPERSPYVSIPALFFRLIGTKRFWMYESEAEPALNGRKFFVPQGKTVGGGSSVNAMIYIRGQAQDYDDWRNAGCAGWGYEDVLPFFIKSEANERLAKPFHGTDGPLVVSDSKYRNPVGYAFLRAAQEAGFSFNDDFNGQKQEGVGFYQNTISNAKRGSTAATYLARVRNSKLLTLRTESVVEKLELENGAAVGVHYRGPGTESIFARANEEVVLTAGALSSPKILLLSGVGPATHLAELGIPVKRELSGVGENFRDHVGAPCYAKLNVPWGFWAQDRGLRAIKHGLEYFMFKRGILNSNLIETGGFIDTDGSGRPDIQFHVIPVLSGDVGKEPPSFHGMSINPCVLRPKSSGRVRLRSANAADPILLNANILQAEEDVESLIRGVKMARKIFQSPSLSKLIERELTPGGPPEIENSQIEAHIRSVAKTVYHPAGTCRMGIDEKAVVDPQLRVRGVPRLRVADASIMPQVTSGNTNAPVIMIGERCADFILKPNRA